MASHSIVTYTAPTNIACIKYWGKRVGADVDPELNLPLNSSVSVTLNQAQLRTVTTVVLGADFTQDRLWLNGRYASLVAACREPLSWNPLVMISKHTAVVSRGSVVCNGVALCVGPMQGGGLVQEQTHPRRPS
jgi:hypothetical protein